MYTLRYTWDTNPTVKSAKLFDRMTCTAHYLNIEDDRKQGI